MMTVIMALIWNRWKPTSMGWRFSTEGGLVIKRSMFRRIRELFDWESYVHGHHQVKTTASSEMRIDCINCIDRKKKLYINPDKGVFYCHKCNFNSKNYDVFDFVSKTEGITRFQAMTKVIREYSETT